MTTITPDQQQPEMPPTRWGDSAAATSLPGSMRDLISMIFPVSETPAVSDAHTPPPRLDSELIAALGAILGEGAVSTDEATRRVRTRGKSTPDLLRQRAGDLSDAPDVVVRPQTHEQVAAVLEFAQAHRVAVVPFGGGTAVTGGLAPRAGEYAGVISLDLGQMRSLVAIDLVSQTATLQAGLRGPEAERLLAEHSMMLGHYPQSFEFASIGGFAATRSSGQSSAGYGRFDAMVVGLRVATPRGEVRLGSAPANASGPDLREVFLGSEGTLGVITEVTVRIRPIPEVTVYTGWHWPSFDAGADAMRTLAQADLLPTVLRLSDETETALNLADPGSIGADGAQGGCLMIVGYEGTERLVTARRTLIEETLAGLGGTPLGEGPGQAWSHGRFAAPYLRDSLLDVGVGVETLETATFWSHRKQLYDAVSAALKSSLGESTIVLCHVSHVYPTGCSLYFTVAWGSADPSERLERWLAAKSAASDAIVDCGAAITHHHAVGTDHKPWLPAEIGEVGVEILRAIKAELDPAGILNPGVLIP